MPEPEMLVGFRGFCVLEINCFRLTKYCKYQPSEIKMAMWLPQLIAEVQSTHQDLSISYRGPIMVRLFNRNFRNCNWLHGNVNAVNRTWVL